MRLKEYEKVKKNTNNYKTLPAWACVSLRLTCKVFIYTATKDLAYSIAPKLHAPLETSKYEATQDRVTFLFMSL